MKARQVCLTMVLDAVCLLALSVAWATCSRDGAYSLGIRSSRSVDLHLSTGRKQDAASQQSLFDPNLRDALAVSSYTQAELDLRPCVVVRFYDKQANALPLLLFSLFASAHPNLKALVIDTGKQPYDGLPSLLERINRASNKRWVHAYDKQINDVRAAFPDFRHDDFGYVLTDMALEDVLRRRRDNHTSFDFECDTLTFTNADNLYSPHFLPSMLKSIALEGKDLVASHVISRYNFSKERSARSYSDTMESEIACGTLRSGEDAEFVTSERFLPCCVELGSVMVTKEALERANLRFLVDRLRKEGSGNSTFDVVVPFADTTSYKINREKPAFPRIYMEVADGLFFHELASKSNIVSSVLRRVLMFHL